ncbi:MAG: tetratricopeptide repeat protein, partial [Bacteroidota bacterium]
MTTKRMLWIVAAGAVVLTGRAVSAQKSPMAQAAYARAQDQLVGSHFSEAATELEAAVRFEPRYAMWWYLLASTSRRAGNCDRAVAAYRRYMELRPADPDPHFGAGLCLQIVGDLPGAAAAFQRFVATDQRPASAPFVQTARARLAELARLTAAATAPRPPSAALLQARQARDQGRSDEAVTQYRAAIAADGRSPEAHAELGTLLVSLRRNGDAVEELRTAVRLAPAAAPA